MFEHSSFGRNLNMLQRTMDVAELRRAVIANNVANVETPDFKRSEVSFEAELGRAIASEESRPAMLGRQTHERHMDLHPTMDSSAVQPRVSLDYLTIGNNNGNNVDIEREELDALKNQMSYELMTKMVSHEFTMINMVIR